MRIQLTAQVTIEDEGHVLDESALPGRQGRLVLARLALDQAPVHRDLLAELLWPDELPSTWERTLSGVVSRLRSAFVGAELGRVQIANAFGCYELQVPPDASIDVRDAALAVLAAEAAAASGDTDRGLAAAQEAAQIASSPFLTGQEGPWIEERRADLRTIHLRALDVIAEVTRGTGRAVDAAREAIALDPARERSHLALMRALAAVGETAQALRAYEAGREALASELGIDPSPESQQLYLELLRADDESARRSLAVQRGWQRAQRAAGALERIKATVRTRFIGREREIREVTDAIERSRLVTLTGAGGVGKTRLALEVASEAQNSARDGAYFCDLGPVRDGEAVVRVLADAVGALDPLASVDVSGVVDALADAEILVVLDNCEHVLADAARLTRGVLDGCPGVRILATSREHLGVHGEHRYRVPSMSATDEAVRLFEDRARAIRPDLTLGDPVAGAVRRICSVLDGIPLAIELAAARLATMSPVEVAEHLQDSVGFLSAAHGSIDRHSTLLSAIGWSYDLLDREQAALFRRLAVFVGGFSAAAAEQVCGDASQLGDLVDRSLVVADVTDDGTTRYKLLEPIRRFAEMKLEEAGEQAEGRRAHRDFMLAMCRGASWGVQVNEERVPIIIRELPNVVAALRWSVDQRDAAQAMDIAINTYGVWRYIGRPNEARDHLESALGLADERPSLVRASCLGFLGEVNMHHARIAASHAAYVRALEIFRRRELDEGIAWTLVGLSDTLHSMGRIDEMNAASDEATSLFERMGDVRGLAWSLSNDAGLSFSAADTHRSRERAESCVALADAPAETVIRMQGLLGILDVIGGDSAGRGRYEVALRSLSGASRFELHWLAMMIGGSEVCLPSFLEAGRSHLGLALKMARAGGMVRPVPWSFEVATRVAAETGKMREAALLFGAAETSLDRSGDRSPWGPFRTVLGETRACCVEALGDGFAKTYAEGAVLGLPAAAALCAGVLG